MNTALVRRSVVVVALILFLLMLAAPAHAHATYKSSNPADESTVSSPPSQITAEFTEPMADGSYMDVTDPCGRDVGSGSSQTGSSMSVQNSGTAAGTYVVFWRAVSIDSHITEGTFTFSSSGGEACPGEEEDDDAGTGGGGGGSKTGGSGGGSGGSSGGSDTSTADAGSSGTDKGHGGSQHDKHGPGAMKGNDKKKSGGGGSADDAGPLAGGPQTDVPDVPSALEGIPIDGLLITLGAAAFIGAAAGKIYVALSGDDS